ncbi:MAG: hypothetical protein JRF47_17145 [Deltaproteobacteria bacterium]|nr:hypothetical protein [Deltaproteobacteria bacterium]
MYLIQTWLFARREYDTLWYTLSRKKSCQELPYKTAKEQTLQSFNTGYINNILTASQGNVTRAAKLCGLERQALQQIMRRYGIKADPFRT